LEAAGKGGNDDVEEVLRRGHHRGVVRRRVVGAKPRPGVAAQRLRMLQHHLGSQLVHQVRRLHFGPSQRAAFVNGRLGRHQARRVEHVELSVAAAVAFEVGASRHGCEQASPVGNQMLGKVHRPRHLPNHRCRCRTARAL
jgi:hypothetical protein